MVALPVMFSAETEREEEMSSGWRSDEGLEEKVLEDGAVQVDLDRRFLMRSVGRIGPDGNLETGCVGTREEQEKFMREAGSALRAEVVEAGAPVR